MKVIARKKKMMGVRVDKKIREKRKSKILQDKLVKDMQRAYRLPDFFFDGVETPEHGRPLNLRIGAGKNREPKLLPGGIVFTPPNADEVMEPKISLEVEGKKIIIVGSGITATRLMLRTRKDLVAQGYEVEIRPTEYLDTEIGIGTHPFDVLMAPCEKIQATEHIEQIHEIYKRHRGNRK